MIAVLQWLLQLRFHNEHANFASHCCPITRHSNGIFIAIVFVWINDMGACFIIYILISLWAVLFRKMFLKSHPRKNRTSQHYVDSPVVTKGPVNCNRINKNSQRGVSTMRPNADLSIASLKVWQAFKKGIDWRRRGSSVLSGQKRANTTADSSCCFKSAPNLSNYTTAHKGDGGGFKTSPPQDPAEINEPRLQSSNTPLTKGPPAEWQYRE